MAVARVASPEGFEVRERRVGNVPLPYLNTDTPDDDFEESVEA